MFVTALLTCLSLPALAEDAPTDPSPADVGAIDPAEAQAMRTISRQELAWLEPRPGRLPQNPYAQVDFTAYTLEWGEARVGLSNLAVGVLPRTQLGISPPLYALGIRNGQAKVDALRLGPVDVAVEGRYYQLGLGEFRGFQSNVGGDLSVRLIDPWSLHAKASYTVLGADGMPDLASLSPVITSLANSDLWELDLSEVAPDVDLHVRARSITVSVATDFRVNRRDSVILQGQTRMYNGLLAEVDTDLPAIFGLDKLANQDETGGVSLRDSYVASMAWQFAWKRAQLRAGIGISSIPGAWVLQSTELSWRLGGPSRNTERRMRQAWRRNRKQPEVAAR